MTRWNEVGRGQRGQTAQRTESCSQRQEARAWFRLAQSGSICGFDLCGARAGHQAPSFAIFFVERFASAVGIEAQAFAGGESVDGDDVPQIFRDDPGDEEIDFVASVGGPPSGGLDAIARLGVALGGFDLNAPEVAVSGVEEKVVALAVSPRLGDAEAQAGGFGEEGGLGGFSPTLAGGEADGVDVELKDGFICRYAGWGSHNKKSAA